MSSLFGGKKKKSNVKAKAVQSLFGNDTKATFDTPFATASTNRSFGTGGPGLNNIPGGDEIVTTLNLDPDLERAVSLAQSGTANQLGFLNQSPDERFSFIRSGEDPFFNQINEQLQRAEDSALGRARVNAQRTGNLNSTALGGAVGTILNDRILRDNQALLDAFNFGSQNARADLGANLGALSGIAGLTLPLAQAANSNFFTAQQIADAVRVGNANRQLQADLTNSQLNAQNQGGNGLFGSLLSVGGTLLGNSLIPGLGGGGAPAQIASGAVSNAGKTIPLSLSGLSSGSSLVAPLPSLLPQWALPGVREAAFR